MGHRCMPQSAFRPLADRTEYRYRPLLLEKTNVTVPNALFRYALSRVVRDRWFARLVLKQAKSAEAKGTAGARVKFRAEAILPQQAKAIAHDAGVNDLSTILRGKILTVDVLLAAPKQRAAMKHDLRLLAVGSGA